MKIRAVVETAVYVDDLQAAEAFYGTVLGLRVMGSADAEEARTGRPSRRAALFGQLLGH